MLPTSVFSSGTPLLYDTTLADHDDPIGDVFGFWNNRSPAGEGMSVIVGVDEEAKLVQIFSVKSNELPRRHCAHGASELARCSGHVGTGDGKAQALTAVFLRSFSWCTQHTPHRKAATRVSADRCKASHLCKLRIDNDGHALSCQCSKYRQSIGDVG